MTRGIEYVAVPTPLPGYPSGAPCRPYTRGPFWLSLPMGRGWRAANSSHDRYSRVWSRRVTAETLASGTRAGRSVTGNAYVELTGYADGAAATP